MTIRARSIFPLAAMLLCLGVPSGASADDDARSVDATALVAQEMWRLERGLDRWSAACRAPRSGEASASARLLRDGQRLVRAVDGLARAIPHVDADRIAGLRRKHDLLRSEAAIIEGRMAKGIEASCNGRAAERSSPRSAVAPVVRAAADCAGAPLIGEGSVMWDLPAARGRVPTDLVQGEAWFRVDAPGAGRFEAHTRGSTADTQLEVHGACPAPGAAPPRPLAENDDGPGLQSAVAFEMAAGESRWIRVRQLVGRANDALQLTVRGAETSVSGVVTAEETGAPLAGIRVEIRDRADGDYEGADYTEADGSYRVSGMEPGTYVAIIDDADGYLRELWNDLPCYDGCEFASGDAIEVLEGGAVTGIDFALLRAGSISGRLRDSESGEAIAHHYVRVSDSDGHYVDGPRTDAAGRYQVTDLPPGVYFVNTDDDGYRNEIYDGFPCAGYCDGVLDGTPIQVLAEGEVRDIDFDLDRLGRVAGRVTDAVSGDGISFLDVDAYDATGDRVGSADTDFQGYYEIGGLASGQHYVATDGYRGHRNEVFDDLPCAGSGSGNCVPLTGSPIAVTEGETTVGIDFALEPLGSVVGQVVDADTAAPIAGVSVYVWDALGSYEESGYTNAVGIYVIEDLAGGNYFASTDDQEEYIDEVYDDQVCPLAFLGGCDPTTGTPIPVMLGDATEGIDFALVEGGVVTGRLFDDFTGALIEGEEVQLWSATGALVGSERSEAGGTFRIPGLPPGTYHATSRSFGLYIDELYEDLPCPGGAPSGCDPTTGSAIAVVTGATTDGIDLHLALAGGISGRVTDAVTDDPLPGVAIDVWSDAGEHLETVATATDGSYLVDLRSGSFYLSTDAGGDFVNQLYEGRSCFGGAAILGGCDPLLGTPVPVIGSEPAVPDIDFALARKIFTASFESGSLCGWSQVVPPVCE